MHPNTIARVIAYYASATTVPSAANYIIIISSLYSLHIS